LAAPQQIKHSLFAFGLHKFYEKPSGVIVRHGPWTIRVHNKPAKAHFYQSSHNKNVMNWRKIMEFG
jgi:hypothetical protein